MIIIGLAFKIPSPSKSFLDTGQFYFDFKPEFRKLLIMAPPQFTKVFVEDLVKEPVTEFAVKTGSNPGDNVAGDIYAIKVETVSGKTYNLVIKVFPDNNPELLEYVRGFQLFALEMSMYTKFKEALETLVKSHGCSEEEFPVPLPPYFGGLCDGVNDFLCLADMRPEGYKMPDKYAGLNFEEISLIMKDLGKFHGLTYSLIKYEGESFFNNVEGMQKLAHNFFTESNPMVDGMIEVMFGSGLHVAKEILSKRNASLAEKLKQGIGKSEVVPLVKFIGEMTDKRAFPVIVHGDFWVNNILIKYDQSGKPISTKFIDFQQTRRGNIYDDLAYFIFTSTTPAFRKNHLPQMLHLYYKSFMSTVERLKIPVPTNFTLGSFTDTFFECYKSTLVYMTYAVPLQLGVDPESGNPNQPQDPTEKMMKRLTRMLERSQRAYDRLESIVQEFTDLNLL